MSTVFSTSHHVDYCGATRNARRAQTIASVVAANAIIWNFAVFIGQVDLSLKGGGALESVGLLSVALSSAIATMLGWGLLTFLESRAAQPWRTWSVIAVIVLVVSMLGPLSAETATGTVVLSVMHAVAFAIMYKSFGRTVRS